MSICTPEYYKSQTVQDLIAKQCKSAEQQWIYELINKSHGVPSTSSEEILLNNKDWILCNNKKTANDTTHCAKNELFEQKHRYLVIFKDRELHTIRDLTSKHIDMLLGMRASVYAFLRQKHGKRAKEYCIFFHYMPSVFQLHAHVNVKQIQHVSVRRQPLGVVLHNLLQNSAHYRDAMILTISTLRSRSTQRCWRSSKTSKDSTGDSASTPCIQSLSQSAQSAQSAASAQPAQSTGSASST